MNKFNYYNYNKINPYIKDTIRNLIKQLTYELGITNKGKKYRKQKEAIKHVCFNLAINSPFHISRKKDRYNIPERYKWTFNTYNIMIPLLDLLEDLGYLTQEIGVWAEERETVISKTDKYDRVFNSFIEIAVDSLDRMPPQEVIIMRDFPVIIKTEKHKYKIKKSIKYKDTQNTIRMRKRLEKYNKFTQQQDIRIVLKHIPLEKSFIERVFNLEKSRIIKINKLLDNYLDISLVYNYCHRVFNNRDWRQGGRFYGCAIQQFGKSKNEGVCYRHGVLINNCDTVELDFSGLHIRMLYHKLGCSYLTDPYDIPLIPRNYLKMAVLRMINAESRKEAGGSLSNYLQEVTGKNVRQKTKYIIDAIVEKHTSIKDYFFSGVGVELQNTDSRIMEEIMNDLTKREIPALFIHDSIIVQTGYKNMLNGLMIKYYKKYMNGFNPIIN